MTFGGCEGGLASNCWLGGLMGGCEGGDSIVCWLGGLIGVCEDCCSKDRVRVGYSKITVIKKENCGGTIRTDQTDC